MLLTLERTETLGKYLTEDPARAKALLDLSAEDAAKKLKDEGYDFTAEELAEFGENLAAASSAAPSGELSEENLQNVSGGVLAAAAAGVYLTCISIGVGLGLAAGKHRW